MHALGAGLQWDSEKFGTELEPKTGRSDFKALRFRCERGRQGVQTQLAIQVAARTCVQFVETSDGAHNPPRIN